MTAAAWWTHEVGHRLLVVVTRGASSSSASRASRRTIACLRAEEQVARETWTADRSAVAACSSRRERGQLRRGSRASRSPASAAAWAAARTSLSRLCASTTRLLPSLRTRAPWSCASSVATASCSACCSNAATSWRSAASSSSSRVIRDEERGGGGVLGASAHRAGAADGQAGGELGGHPLDAGLAEVEVLLAEVLHQRDGARPARCGGRPAGDPAPGPPAPLRPPARPARRARGDRPASPRRAHGCAASRVRASRLGTSCSSWVRVAARVVLSDSTSAASERPRARAPRSSSSSRGQPGLRDGPGLGGTGQGHLDDRRVDLVLGQSQASRPARPRGRPRTPRPRRARWWLRRPGVPAAGPAAPGGEPRAAA